MYGKTTINLEYLNQNQGFKIYGYGNGASVSGAGDVNNDGFNDVIISATSGPSSMLYTFVVFGSNRSISKINLETLKPDEGFAIITDSSVKSVKSAGDINKDGFEDLIIGMPYYKNTTGSSTGAAYIIFGNSTDNLKDVSVYDLSSSSKFGFVAIYGAIDSNLGSSVSGAGDINNDGYDDIIVGASNYKHRDPFLAITQGAAYIIFGNSELRSEIYISDGLLSNEGFAIYGYEDYSCGVSVSGAGDINGDGYDDVAVGCPTGANQGRVYVVYGKEKNFTNIVLTNKIQEDTGVCFTEVDSNCVKGDENFGYAASMGFNINNDQLGDLIIGVPCADQAYIIYGFNKTRDSGCLYPHDYDPIVIDGVNNGDKTGFSVSYGGDINKDGYGDVIIGSPNSNNKAGICYILYGGYTQTDYTQYIYLNDLNSEQGITVNGIEGDEIGYSISNIGDFNKDGYSDIIIGSNTQGSYILFGADSGFATLSPTSSPKKSDNIFDDIQNFYDNNQAISIILSGSASLGALSLTIRILSWCFNKKIYTYVLNEWGHNYKCIYNPENYNLEDNEIGLFINREKKLVAIIDHKTRTIEEPNFAVDKIRKAFIFSNEEKQIILSNLDKVDIRNFLINEKLLMPKKILCCFYSYTELGYVKGFIYNSYIVFRERHRDDIAPSSEKMGVEAINPLNIDEQKSDNNLLLESNTEEFDCELTKRESVLNSICAMMDQEHVELQNEEFIRFANHLTYFIKEDVAKNIGYLSPKLHIEDGNEVTQVVSIYKESASATHSSFASSENLITSLLNAKQMLHNLPLLHYITQNAIDFLGYNISLPDPSDNRPLLVSLDLVLGNMAAQYLPAESVMNGMLISTASSISFAASLTAADYLKNQEISDESIEFAEQCGMTITAHSLPSIVNYAFAKAFLPNVEMSTLDMLGSTSFGVVQCYNNYKAAYEAESSALNTVVPYISDALTLWSLKGYINFEASSVGSLSVSIKNAISVAATTYAAHCVSDVMTDFIPQEIHEYVDTAFSYVTETLNDLIDNL